jgi:hypothetical protein
MTRGARGKTDAVEAPDAVEMAAVDGWMHLNMVQTDGAATAGGTGTGGKVEASNLRRRGQTAWEDGDPWRSGHAARAGRGRDAGVSKQCGRE